MSIHSFHMNRDLKSVMVLVDILQWLRSWCPLKTNYQKKDQTLFWFPSLLNYVALLFTWYIIIRTTHISEVVCDVSIWVIKKTWKCVYFLAYYFITVKSFRNVCSTFLKWTSLLFSVTILHTPILVAPL